MVTATTWKADLDRVFKAWAARSSGIILSADVDGLLSCALLATAYPVNVIGIYTTTHLVLLDGATKADASRALWLDHDVSEPGVMCVGQHLVHHRSTDVLPRREAQSFNPNVWTKQSWKESFSGRTGKKRDKYPYGTAHFIANALGVDPDNSNTHLAALFAHADGTWRTVIDYKANADIWFDLMFQDDKFLSHLRQGWATSSAHLGTHLEVVNHLVSCGVANGQSRAKIAVLLPENLRALTGRQSIRFDIRNLQPSVDKVAVVLDYISAQVGSKPTIGKKHTLTVSGSVETPYPNTITNFDDFMVDNIVFSHAFTDLRTLRFTTGINLQT